MGVRASTQNCGETIHNKRERLSTFRGGDGAQALFPASGKISPPAARGPSARLSNAGLSRAQLGDDRWRLSPPRSHLPPCGQLKDEEPELLIPYLRLDCFRDSTACPYQRPPPLPHVEGEALRGVLGDK